MPKRLAITISGAVSLGSYEAGVLFEILDAIGQHNANPVNPRIEVDVLTGASAGGMTATIAAQKLLYEGSALHDPYANPFYLAWVADVSLDALLTYQPTDDPAKSALSSQYIIDLSRRLLTHRYDSHIDPPQEPHPAAANALRLGLAMSNLNGVDYSMPMLPSGTFTYTRHEDQLAPNYALDNATDSLDVWEPLRCAAVACGAFPFAFRVQDVVRHGVEYPGANPPVLPTQTFAYTDGGVFQNEPLGLAKNLVDEMDRHLDVENRFYLFVSPNGKTSAANADFNAGKARYIPTAMRLAGAVLDQAGFQDWIMAERVNAQVAAFDAQAMALHAFLAGAPDGRQQSLANNLQAAANELLPPLYNNPRAGAPNGETFQEAQTRLSKQFAPEVARLPSPIAKTWIDSILVLEKSGELATRDQMTIFGVTASHSELASFELCSFAGFFDRRFRDHDYDVGRMKARTFLQQPGALGPINYVASAIRPIDETLNGLTFDRMDRGLREHVRDRLLNQADAILKACGFGWLLREGAEHLVLRALLNSVFKL